MATELDMRVHMGRFNKAGLPLILPRNNMTMIEGGNVIEVKLETWTTSESKRTLKLSEVGFSRVHAASIMEQARNSSYGGPDVYHVSDEKDNCIANVWQPIYYDPQVGPTTRFALEVVLKASDGKVVTSKHDARTFTVDTLLKVVSDFTKVAWVRPPEPLQFDLVLPF